MKIYLSVRTQKVLRIEKKSINSQTEADVQKSEETSANQPVQQQGSSSWEQILPNETLDLLKEKMVNVSNLKVSYVEMVIDLNGEEEDVHTFVDRLENLKRIIHVQSYDYSI